MPLGDSITQGSASGEPDPDFQESYRLDLWDQLVNAGYDVDFVGSRNSGSSIPDFDADHEGHPGWHADGNPSGNDVLDSVYTWLADSDPVDVVLLGRLVHPLLTKPLE